MKRIVLSLAALGCGLAGAQTHAVKKPETVVRAIAVYEWTGDEAKPTASRLVPVSIFIDNQFEDAGIYLARPVPFALDRGTVFEVQQAGVPEGTLELALQRHLENTSHTPFDSGWLGQGLFKPVVQAPVVAAKKSTKPLPQVIASGGSGPKLTNRSDSSSTDDAGKPTMKRRDGDATDATTSDAKSTPTVADDDPNKPVLVRRAGSESGDTTAASDTTGTSSTKPADDSNGPTMQRRTDSTDTTGDSSSDVDRPTLKKRTPQQQAQNQKKKGDTASVTSVGSLNDDPDRPTLHRGGADGIGNMALLLGVPADMHQMVAVSDAKDRPQHDFSRQWESSQERSDVQGKLEAEAQARIAKYDPPVAAAPVAPPPASKTGAKTKKAVEPPPPAPAPYAAELADVSLKGFTLSYGGAATFVYSASSPAANGVTRYVTIVAQREPLGELKVALASVTDSLHLDRTPWMRLVDVVDAEASNRASLLFEMRGQTARQFALYRVIGAQAEQIFETGTVE